MQFLKLENTSKEGSVIKNHAPCCGEETKNEAKLAREPANGKVMLEEEVDPLIKKEKHKEQQTPEGAPPNSEEEQAMQQWLQRIPDDPGELLRNKFRYQTQQRLFEQLQNPAQANAQADQIW